jgi:hypothetical protein
VLPVAVLRLALSSALKIKPIPVLESARHEMLDLELVDRRERGSGQTSRTLLLLRK